MERQILHAPRALLPDGWQRDVTVQIASDGRIAEVTPGVQPPAGAEILRDRALLPAPANVHSHTFQRAMAGLTEHRTGTHDSFWTWRDLMYRFLTHLRPEDIAAIAAWAMMEMLEAGYAAVAEFHYLHHAPDGTPYTDRAELAGRIAQATADTGIGLTLLPTLYHRGGLNNEPLQGGQTRFANSIDGFADLLAAAERHTTPLGSNSTVGVAAHSLRAVSEENLRRAAALRPDRPFHIHIAEQRAEVAAVEQATGARPVAWLTASMDVDARWCLIHATHLTAPERNAIATTGATVGLCPVTEANLGDGVFPLADHLEDGGLCGIGTDSNVLISLADELRTLEYGQRLRHEARAIGCLPPRSNGRTLFDMACRAGATALGRNCGQIREGAWADLMTLDMETPATTGLDGDQLLDAWLFSSANPRVHDLWSAGRHVVVDGRHIKRDALEAPFRDVVRRLRAVL